MIKKVTFSVVVALFLVISSEARINASNILSAATFQCTSSCGANCDGSCVFECVGNNGCNCEANVAACCAAARAANLFLPSCEGGNSN